ncbi:MAG: hypothetical protein M1561_07475 [Gammaproteobacteria bacterium]|nr:hypothetical protein [Gammaproteobacteria bacterium]
MTNAGTEQKSKAKQTGNDSFLADLMIFFGTIFFVVASVCLVPELDYSIAGAAFLGVGAICFSIGIYSKTTVEDFSAWLAKCSKTERIGILILGVMIALVFLASSGLTISSLANANIGVFASFLGAESLGIIPAIAIGAAALVYGLAIIAISWTAYSNAEDIYQAKQKETSEEDEYEDEALSGLNLFRSNSRHSESLSSAKKNNEDKTNSEAKVTEDEGKDHAHHI